MKLDHCAAHTGSADLGMSCYRIRHDDGKIATPAEIWAAMFPRDFEIGGEMTEWQPIETAPKDGTRVLREKMNDPITITITDSAFFDPLRDAGAATGLESLRLRPCEPDGTGVGAACRPASGSESRNARLKELARAQRVQDEVRRMHGLLLWALYHHQGASSPVGQPIRRALGIGEHDHMTPEQIELAKAMGLLHGT